MSKKLFLTRAAMLLLVAIPTIPLWAQGSFSGSGTEDDPYRISNMDEWNLFAELVAGGATFSGKFVKQVDQIGDQNGNPYNGITTMVGESEGLSFQGTYDGSKYYIIGSINSTADYAAPFRFVKNVLHLQ